MLIAGKRSVLIAGPASLIDGDRDMAWAERSIKPSKAYKYLIGKYVEAEKANSNGQYWKLEDLKESAHTLNHAPLNFAHHAHRIMGHFLDSEMMYPKVSEAAGEGYTYEQPYLEALALIYKFYFPRALVELEQAHADGQLFLSMECVSESVTCIGDEGCGKEYPYQGPKSDTYCAHINEDTSVKQLNKPFFLAGALLVPPVQPGWAGASVQELSAMLSAYAVEAEKAYEGVQEMAPHADPKTWESVMMLLLQQVQASDLNRK